MFRTLHRGVAYRQLIATIAAFALGAGAAHAEMEHTTLAIPGVNVLFLAQYIASDLHLWEKQDLDVKVLAITGIGSMNWRTKCDGSSSRPSVFVGRASKIRWKFSGVIAKFAPG